jgi:hypothetical protein
VPIVSDPNLSPWTPPTFGFGFALGAMARQPDSCFRILNFEFAIIVESNPAMEDGNAYPGETILNVEKWTGQPTRYRVYPLGMGIASPRRLETPSRANLGRCIVSLFLGVPFFSCAIVSRLGIAHRRHGTAGPVVGCPQRGCWCWTFPYQIVFPFTYVGPLHLPTCPVHLPSPSFTVCFLGLMISLIQKLPFWHFAIALPIADSNISISLGYS